MGIFITMLGSVIVGLASSSLEFGQFIFVVMGIMLVTLGSLMR